MSIFYEHPALTTGAATVGAGLAWVGSAATVVPPDLYSLALLAIVATILRLVLKLAGNDKRPPNLGA